MTCCWVSLLLFFSLCSKVLSSTPLISFKVPIAPKSLLWNYWINETFYAEFLSSGLHNQKITVSPWLKVNPFNSRAISRSLQREVRSFHPLHKDHSYLRLLGGTIPPFAESIREQTLEILPGPQSCFKLFEQAYFRGLPFADSMVVEVVWVVKACQGHSQSSEVSIFVEPVFRRSSIFNKIISANTCRELKSVFQLWNGMLVKQSSVTEDTRDCDKNIGTFFMGQ